MDTITNRWNPFDHHRGPFELSVIRSAPRKGKGAPWTQTLLRGRIHGSEVEEEAKCLLTDPRDTIEAVSVWSVTEQQHVVTYKKEA